MLVVYIFSWKKKCRFFARFLVFLGSAYLSICRYTKNPWFYWGKRTKLKSSTSGPVCPVEYIYTYYSQVFKYPPLGAGAGPGPGGRFPSTPPLVPVPVPGPSRPGEARPGQARPGASAIANAWNSASQRLGQAATKRQLLVFFGEACESEIGSGRQKILEIKKKTSFQNQLLY